MPYTARPIGNTLPAPFSATELVLYNGSLCRRCIQRSREYGQRACSPKAGFCPRPSPPPVTLIPRSIWFTDSYPPYAGSALSSAEMRECIGAILECSAAVLFSRKHVPSPVSNYSVRRQPRAARYISERDTHLRGRPTGEISRGRGGDAPPAPELLQAPACRA
ncbi:hypothetical protein FIBSPDRAFT_893769 [Athelia psychrophila]|uniref:Uncharacterized protein n=1 Tax=Athelia psychrophila TaxID=1759441 RepID=A0A166GPK3_9AGAM|nr:hypothetical protein FIBSPDRAFT_893769 [Fibularhizoctonia sp. CBS 109695]